MKEVKKFYFYILIIFGALNILLMIFLIVTNKKYIDKVDNKFISFEIPEGYYYNEKYEKTTDKFKLYNKDNSTIEIYLLNSPYSNNTLYTKEEIARSINYQLLKDTVGYIQSDFTYRNNMFYSKYENQDNIVEIIIRYKGQKIMIISYITSNDIYDKYLLDNLNDKVVLK